MKAKFKNGHALLIGVSRQKNHQEILALPMTETDVTAIKDVLENPARGSFPPRQVKILTGSSAKKQRILNELDRLAKNTTGNPDASIIIYFSGHGALQKDPENQSEKYYLIPYDFELEKPDQSGIEINEFYNKIHQINNGNILIIMDCCYSASSDFSNFQLPENFKIIANSKPISLPDGQQTNQANSKPISLPDGQQTNQANSKPISLPDGQQTNQANSKPIGSAEKPNNTQTPLRNTTITWLFSSKNNEYSYIYEKKGMSVFTYHLIEALNGNGLLLLSEGTTIGVFDLAAHLRRSVPETTELLFPGATQTPIFEFRGAGFPVAALRGGEEAVAVALRNGSKAYFEKLTGPGGRFEHLVNKSGINNGQLQNTTPIDESILAKVKGKRRSPSLDMLQKEWKTKEPNILLLGEEGMGKTINMLRIWQQHLAENKENVIPLYIPLTQYNQLTSDQQDEFIRSFIIKNYLEEFLKGDGSNLNKRFTKWADAEHPAEKTSPKLLLLLDGLNEITTDTTPLLVDLDEFWIKDTKRKGIQLMVSSRINANHKFSDDFSEWQLNPLSLTIIKKYLSKTTGLPHDLDEDSPLTTLLNTPMMLTLFADSLSEMSINSTGELLLNFVNNKLARFEKSHTRVPEKSTRNHFLLNYLLPFIAYEMELLERFEITEDQLESIIKKAFGEFNNPDFLQAGKSQNPHIKRYRKHIQALQLGEKNLVEEIKRFEDIVKDFMHELFPVSWEAQSFRFIHQSFQDFFAACYIINQVKLSIDKGELNPILKETMLHDHLRKMIGQIAKEHYFEPKKQAESKKKKRKEKKSYFVKLLDLCRGISDINEIGHTVWNILNIWKDVREEQLSGVDFSGLNLDGFNFNGVKCENSKWGNSLLSPSQWFPHGHENGITKVRISPNGKYLLSASADHTLKLWLTETNQHIRTFHCEYGHDDTIYSIAFSPNGQTIISGGKDHKIIEWSVETGQCLKVYRGHSATIREVNYHPKGKRFLSASEDGSVKEWSCETGKCIAVCSVGYGSVLAICYNEKGNAFFAGSKDGPITEWSIKKDASKKGTLKKITLRKRIEQKCTYGLCLSPKANRLLALSTKGLKKNKKWVLQEWKLTGKEAPKQFALKRGLTAPEEIHFVDLAYNSTAKYLQVAGLDNNIYAWPTNKRSKDTKCQAIQTIIGHSQPTTSIAYHPKKPYIYSGAMESTIKKWFVFNGQCRYTFQPQTLGMNDLFVLSNTQNCRIALADGTVRKWLLKEGRFSKSDIITTDSSVLKIAFYKDPDNENNDLWITGDEQGQIHVWSNDYSCIRCYKEHYRTRISALAVDPVSGMVASADENGKLMLWSLLDETIEHVYPFQAAHITHLKFSPEKGEARHFVSSNTAGELALWLADKEVCQQAPLKAPKKHGSRVNIFDFNGKHIVSGGTDGTLKEWDIDNHKTTNPDMEISFGVPISHITYSPDHNNILMCFYRSILELAVIKEDNKRVVDPSQSKLFKSHRSCVLSAQYVNGKRILSVSKDSILMVWDRETGERINGEFEQIFGLNVENLDFRNVKWTEPLSDREWNRLKTHGAILSDEDIKTEGKN